MSTLNLVLEWRGLSLPTIFSLSLSLLARLIGDPDHELWVIPAFPAHDLHACACNPGPITTIYYILYY